MANWQTQSLLWFEGSTPEGTSVVNNAKFDNAIDISKVDTSELPTPKRSPRKKDLTKTVETVADSLDIAVMSSMFDAVGDILGSLAGGVAEGIGDILSGI